MIRLEHIEKTYDKRTSHANHVLRDISLELPDTGFVCILGPSGCGKTTLMNVMGGLDSFDSGTITAYDVSAKRYGTRQMENERNSRFGYIFQNYYLLPERSVTYNVYLGLHSADLGRIEKLKRVKAALQAVEMDKYARKNVKDLSGGQQQRVAIARALVRQPQVIFADEPTGNLDEINTDNICGLLRGLAKNCLVVMVTHEERIAEEYADRVIMLEQGRIVSDRKNVPVKAGSCDNVGDEAELFVGESGQTELQDGKDRKDKKLVGRSWNESGLKSILTETRELLTARGKRTGALWACLAALTAMLVLSVGDYLTVSNIDPEDFITMDSHLIQIEVLREGYSTETIADDFLAYLDYLDESGLDITYIPLFNSMVTYNYESFQQMNTLEENMFGFSFVPIEKLDEEDLLYGRMPELAGEVVADRWMLEQFMEGNGVLQASIADVTHFLGETISLPKKGIELKVVGICDSGDPSVYADPYLLISIAAGGTKAITLEQFKKQFPGKYDDIVLETGEVLIGRAAGTQVREGGTYSISSDLGYLVKGLALEDIYAQIVVKDYDEYEPLLRTAMSKIRKIMIYSEEKDKVKEYVTNLPEELASVIQVVVTDPYTASMDSYRAAVAQKVNARTIVTLTILLIAAVMLFLLLKTRVDGRKEMLGVYRLLGIDGKKTLAIFALESVCLSLTAALPAAVAAWAVIKALTVMPSISFSMILPLSAALSAYCVSLVFHLAASLIPAVRLLSLPPAVLAGRYDF